MARSSGRSAARVHTDRVELGFVPLSPQGSPFWASGSADKVDVGTLLLELHGPTSPEQPEDVAEATVSSSVHRLVSPPSRCLGALFKASWVRTGLGRRQSGGDPSASLVAAVVARGKDPNAGVRGAEERPDPGCAP